MTKNATLCVTVWSLLMGSAAGAADCSLYEHRFSELNESSKPQFAEIEDDANKLSNLASGLSDDALENMIGIDIDITMREKRLVFDTPSLTMQDRNIILAVPQVTMRQRDIKFDVPKTYFEPKKTGQYPEVFCEDTWIKVGPVKTKGVPKCATRWSDIITNVPVVRMETTTISTKIPEFKVDETTIYLKIPEFFMERQEILVKIPEIEATDLKAEQENLKIASDQVQARSEVVQSNQAASLKGLTQEMYACFISNTNDEKRKAIEEFDRGIREIDSAIREVSALGLNPASIPSDSGAVNLVAMKDELQTLRGQAIADFDEALTRLDREMNDALARL